MASELSERTKFRRALQAALHEQLVGENGTKLEVRGAKLEGPQERDIACVWWTGKRPHRAAILEENYYRIRLFRRFKQDQGAAVPAVDQSEALEFAADELEAALKAVLTQPALTQLSGLPASDHDFLNAIEVAADSDGQFVETSIVAFATNRSAHGM